jgi:hypothetical protein
MCGDSFAGTERRKNSAFKKTLSTASSAIQSIKGGDTIACSHHCEAIS